ncbi:hypothetical protein HK102_012532, partial [Quaeritorhiza haematococci]
TPPRPQSHPQSPKSQTHPNRLSKTQGRQCSETQCTGVGWVCCREEEAYSWHRAV